MDLLLLEDGEFVDGQWKMYRKLNGDEAASLRYEKPTLLWVKMFAYQ